MKKPLALIPANGKANIRKRRAKARRLKQEFDAAHRQGMDALKKGDYAKLGKAIETERVVVKEQAAIAEKASLMRPKARKRNAAKKRG